MRLFGLLVALAVGSSAYAEDWLPVAPEDLQLKSEPRAPNTPAIYLYRQVDRDDNDSDELIYSRIKILTEEGRKYANVELPYLKSRENIRGIKARTIRPDGSVVEFDGTVYEKSLVKARGINWMAKTFTLPNVEVGSIIEYRYRHFMDSAYVFNSRWLLSESLYTRFAKFSLRPNNYFPLRWSWPLGLPAGTQPPKKVGEIIRLEAHDIPAFVSEEHMPPQDVMKFRVDFIYESEGSGEKDFARFWKDFGKRAHKKVEGFIDDRRAMEQAVAQIVQPSDPPETKLRKIYARMQQLRNLSFERNKSEQEEQREKLQNVRDAEDVWIRGYGDGLQITWLYLGLARAAGLDVAALLVPTRDDYFFDAQFMNPAQLNSNAVLAKVDGREIYLDPGTPFTPFGMLPWMETGVMALRLDKAGGTWITTPISESSASRVQRKVTLKLDASGTLEGKATVSYSGLEASWRRLTERNDDAAARKEFLEQEIQGDMPVGIEVKLANTPDWTAADAPLVVEYDLKIPGWAAAAGRRSLLPVGLFGAAEKHTFEHASRVHPIYLTFPCQRADEVVIELPPGWQVVSLPKQRANDVNVARYGMAAQQEGGSLHLKRDLSLNFVLVDKKYYGQLRDFFQAVRAGDEDQVVLSPGVRSAQR